MVKYAFPVFIALAVFCLPGAAAAAERTPTAFLGFESGDIAASGVAILDELVKQEIAIAPDFALVDPAARGAAAAELEFGLSALADPAAAVRAGAQLGARKLAAGRIGILGSLYVITLTLFDVATGTAERTVTQEFVGSLEDLRKPVRIAAQRLLGIKGLDVPQGQFVNVVTDPPGVAVFVNGLFEGSSPVKVTIAKPGKQTVKLEADGYKPWFQTVSVEDNATFFIDAKLLKQDRVIDEKTKQLQDGRFALAVYTGLFGAVASDALIYAATGELGGDHIRLAIGLPLVVAPLAFFATLMATEAVPVTGGRTTMISSSSLWGATWGLTASFAFGADPTSQNRGFTPGFAGLSVVGGLLYGGIAVWLTAGEQVFPVSRAWLFNLGSVCGSLLGLGVPYLFNVDNPTVIYCTMLGGSLAGSAIAWILTADMTEGRNVANPALGALLDIGLNGVRLGLPAASLAPAVQPGGGPGFALYLPLASWRN